MEKIVARPSRDPFARLEEDLRHLLRDAGFPEDPTEGGRYPFRSHITGELENQTHQSIPWYAAAILDELQSLRRAVGEGDAPAAGLAGFRAGDLHRMSLMKFEWETPAMRGAGVPEGGGRTRKDWLNALIEKTYLALKKEAGNEPSAMDVFLSLTQFDAPEESFVRIIHGIDLKHRAIEWTDRRGKDRETSYKSFKHRLTVVKRRQQE